MHYWFSGNLVATPRCSERVLELEHGSQYKNNLRRFFKTWVSWPKPDTLNSNLWREDPIIIYLLNSFLVLAKSEGKKKSKTTTRQRHPTKNPSWSVALSSTPICHPWSIVIGKPNKKNTFIVVKILYSQVSCACISCRAESQVEENWRYHTT